MKSLTINVSIDVENPKHLKAACDFMHVLGGHDVCTASPSVVIAKDPADSSPLETLSDLASVAKRLGVEIPKTVEESEPDPKQMLTSEPDDEPQTEIKVSDLRELASSIIKADKGNRDNIKLKLEELGASSVSNLSPDKYGEFNDFLQDLTNA